MKKNVLNFREWRLNENFEQGDDASFVLNHGSMVVVGPEDEFEFEEDDLEQIANYLRCDKSKIFLLSDEDLQGIPDGELGMRGLIQDEDDGYRYREGHRYDDSSTGSSYPFKFRESGSNFNMESDYKMGEAMINGKSIPCVYDGRYQSWAFYFCVDDLEKLDR